MVEGILDLEEGHLVCGRHRRQYGIAIEETTNHICDGNICDIDNCKNEADYKVDKVSPEKY
jgi:hypothetical protein